MRALILLSILAFTSQLSVPPVTAQTQKSAVPAPTVVDINKADVGALTVLPGIGPSLAQRIVDMRNKRPFRNKRELRRVKGIGFRTFNKLAPRITVGTVQRGANEANLNPRPAKKRRATKLRTRKQSRAAK